LRNRSRAGSTIGIRSQSAFKEEWKMTPSNRNWHRVSAYLILFVVLLAGVGGASAAEPGARTVKYSKEDIVPVHARLRFSTLIVLPEEEEILDFTTGDREFWIINGSHNLCYVHPAQAGIRSNLNLITASGHVYSFLLTEISSDATAQPDLKLFIEPKEGSAVGTVLRGYVHAADAEAYKKEMADLQRQTAEQVRAAQARSNEEINQFRSSYATKLRFGYALDPKASHEPFLVSAIYHDDSFTYIRSAAREKPVFYEIKDGKPNLVSFQLENGVYIVPKIVDAGYLAIGKKKLNFTRQSAGK
jgi:type IV secretory pathway VirB9-like protein